MLLAAALHTLNLEALKVQLRCLFLFVLCSKWIANADIGGNVDSLVYTDDKLPLDDVVGRLGRLEILGVS